MAASTRAVECAAFGDQHAAGTRRRANRVAIAATGRTFASTAERRLLPPPCVVPPAAAGNLQPLKPT